MVRISSARIDLEQARVDNAVIKDYAETMVGGAAGASSGTSYAVDISQGNVFHLILNANCAITFTNPTASGTACSFSLYRAGHNRQPHRHLARQRAVVAGRGSDAY